VIKSRNIKKKYNKYYILFAVIKPVKLVMEVHQEIVLDVMKTMVEKNYKKMMMYFVFVKKDPTQMYLQLVKNVRLVV